MASFRVFSRYIMAAAARLAMHLHCMNGAEMPISTAQPPKVAPTEGGVKSC
jgi:hypothetical protein